MKTRIVSILFVCLILAGCVSSRKYDAAVQELSETRIEVEDAQKEIAQANQKLMNLRRQLDLASEELFDLHVRRQDLQQELVETNMQVEVLRDLEEEQKKRVQEMIDAGELSVTIKNGRIVIELPDKILFDTGQAQLNHAGREALTQVAGILTQFQDRRFQVEGHTDDRPIQSARYPSNWELSAARSLAVVHLLIETGMDPSNISAAGFGEFQPKADNTTPEGRQLNRRIEIVMLPNLDILSDEIPKLVE
jgi:chemotaxis protein MotB